METYGVLVGAIMLVIGGIAAVVRLVMPRPGRAEPAPPSADPGAEARAVEDADTDINEEAAEVEAIDAADPADRTRRAGSRLRR